MASPLPAHLSRAIRQRIALLREAWRVDDLYAITQPRLRGYPLMRQQPERHPRPGTTRTFPTRDRQASTS